MLADAGLAPRLGAELEGQPVWKSTAVTGLVRGPLRAAEEI